MVTGPRADEVPTTPAGIIAAGARWWPLAMARELDDALLMLRANEPEIGTLVLKTSGDADSVLACDKGMLANRDHWFVRETIGLLRRTLQRFDVSSRSLFAVIDEGACFAGSLFELALAADRGYMRAEGPRVALSPLNFCDLEMVNGRTRLATRFNEAAAAAALERHAGVLLDAAAALDLGLAGDETVATKIFGRLSAWQNWIFSRPNAVGDNGALKRYGSGARARFDRERI
jgi:benzoyl-CoA-dihydrodiol lyase